MPATFDAFFHAATATEHNPAGSTPYDYQCRLAGGNAGRAYESQLINVPTGLGKTAS